MTQWNLNNLYDPKDREQLIGELKAKVESFKKHRNALSEGISSDEFMSILKEKEQLSIVSSKLGGFAGLWQCEDTADSKRNAHEAQISELTTHAGNDVMFFTLWFKDLSDKKAKELIADSGKYSYYLERVRQSKPYTLKEDEEKIISLKDLTGVEAITRLYDIMTNQFMFEFEGKKLTQEEINQFKQSFDRKKRVASYDQVLGRYGEEQSALGEIYKTIVSDWRNESITLRGFKSPIAVRNQANDIPDAAIQALLNVVRKNVPLFQEYFKLKAKLLKLDNMDRYDLYAPYSESQKEYSYEKSKEITLNMYKEFSQDAHDYAKKIFDANHVHAFPKKGKRSGAFCWTVLKDLPPYIMLNHVGKLKDLFTMAHEFGHGIHGMAAHNQTQFTYHSALPLAETASIFGEMLLSQKLLKESSKDEKVDILVRNLDSQYASIVRQAYFVLFEIQAHEAIAKGATVEKLNDMYLANLNEQFGDMQIADVFKHEWSYIPHIHHTPFYCYAYAFGNLLVLALYKMYEKEGEDFVPKYMKLLSYGGSKAPADVLKEIGIDITKESFWQQGFDIIKEEVSELKRLVD